MSGFANPIINAAGVLIRTLVKSVNYIAGSLGWQITKDGDAEFNNALLRGIVSFGGGPTQTRMVILGSPNLPPPLNTYQFLNDATAIATAAILFYQGTVSDDDYLFLAMVKVGGGTSHNIFIGYVLNGVVLESTPGFPLTTQFQMQSGAFGQTLFRNQVRMSNGSDFQLRTLDASFTNEELSRLMMEDSNGGFGAVKVITDELLAQKPGADQVITTVATQFGPLTGMDAKRSNATYEVTAMFDFHCTAAGGTALFGYLYVDGVQNADVLAIGTLGWGVAGGRITMTKTWRGTHLVAGPHDYRLGTQKSAAVGTFEVLAQGTSWVAELRE